MRPFMRTSIRIIWSVLFVMTLSGTAATHNGALLLYTDGTLADCNSNIGSFETDTIRLYYVRNNGPDMGKSCEFRLEASTTDALFLGTEWSSQIVLTFGDIFTGIALTASQCLGANESVVYIGSIFVMYTGFSIPPAMFTVRVRESQSTDPPAIRITECAMGDPFSPVFGGSFVFNGSCSPYDPDPDPEQPSGFTGTPWYKDCNLAALHLSWNHNTESNISHYELHKDTSENFIPGPINLITSRADTSFYDRLWRWTTPAYYKVIAVDSDGRESNFALLRPEDVPEISPSRPSGLAGSPRYDNCNLAGLSISWNHNTETDISHYNVYKDTSEDFIPGPSNLLASQVDTIFNDDEWAWTPLVYYKISAVPCSGSESEFAFLRSGDVVQISPSPPSGLNGTPWYYNNSLVALILSWNRNIESDISHYMIYKDASEDFIPGPLNLIASPVDTFFYDAQWGWTPYVYYRVSAVHCDGRESAFAFLRPDDVTGTDRLVTPDATYLAQNFPNPFNPTTQISFGLDKPAKISLRVYDVAGRLVREVAEGELPGGRYERVWDGKDAKGDPVSSGIYFYRLDAGAFTQTRKMVLLR
jgi:hypothetical protein